MLISSSKTVRIQGLCQALLVLVHPALPEPRFHQEVCKRTDAEIHALPKAWTISGDVELRALTLSRQKVLFCVKRRKSWRMLQSKAGIVNLDYKAQRALLEKVDSGAIPLDEFLARTGELYAEELETLNPTPKKPVPVSAK